MIRTFDRSGRASYRDAQGRFCKKSDTNSRTPYEPETLSGIATQTILGLLPKDVSNSNMVSISYAISLLEIVSRIQGYTDGLKAGICLGLKAGRKA